MSNDVSAPDQQLENRDAPQTSQSVPEGVPPEVAWREKNPVRRFLKLLGPGLMTGAADDDPSGIGTYSQAGASLGFATLWTVALQRLI